MVIIHHTSCKNQMKDGQQIASPDPSYGGFNVDKGGGPSVNGNSYQVIP